MSTIARRALIRAIPRARAYAGTADVAKTSWNETQAALRTHAAGTSLAPRRGEPVYESRSRITVL